jgi:methyl-accepting chemotaxis protein
VLQVNRSPRNVQGAGQEVSNCITSVGQAAQQTGAAAAQVVASAAELSKNGEVLKGQASSI